LAAFNAAEAQRKPPVADLFSDCYEAAPAHLQEQQRQFYEHLARHSQHYQVDEFAPDQLTQVALQGQTKPAL
jgi:2-oxoisovalerate dehydrogenase E1 component alpha subunit